MAEQKGKLIVLAFVVFFILCWAGLGTCTEAQRNPEELLQKLQALEEMVKKQQKEIEELKSKLTEQGVTAKKEAERVKEEAKKETEKAIGDSEKKMRDWMPKWINRIQVSGDLRLRYEGIHRWENAKGEDQPNRDRLRLRARLFFDGTISDELSAHFMLCSDDDQYRDPTTTNQTFTDDFNNKGIYIHRAYGMYRPKVLDGLELVMGKFANTFVHTDIMWDPDVNPEGFYEKYSFKGFKNIVPFVHLGQMYVNEVKSQTDDAWLFIEQVGVQVKTAPVDFTFALSWYDWSNLQNTRYLNSAQFKSGGGNTFILANAKPYTVYGYAYDYNLSEAIFIATLKIFPIPIKFTFDYIHNTDDNVPNGQDTAYYLGFDLNKLKAKHDWLLGYKYAKIEKDAVLGSMADMDFYGANRKGHKIYFYYKPVDRLRIGGAYFVTKPVQDWTTAERNSIYKDFGRENRIMLDTIFEF